MLMISLYGGPARPERVRAGREIYSQGPSGRRGPGWPRRPRVGAGHLQPGVRGNRTNQLGGILTFFGHTWAGGHVYAVNWNGRESGGAPTVIALG
jgi:hypothetical protein